MRCRRVLRGLLPIISDSNYDYQPLLKMLYSWVVELDLVVNGRRTCHKSSGYRSHTELLTARHCGFVWHECYLSDSYLREI